MLRPIIERNPNIHVQLHNVMPEHRHQVGPSMSTSPDGCAASWTRRRHRYNPARLICNTENEQKIKNEFKTMKRSWICLR